MSNASPAPSPNTSGPKLPPWLIFVVAAGFLVYGWWQKGGGAPRVDAPVNLPGPASLPGDSDSLPPTTHSQNESFPDGGRTEPLPHEHNHRHAESRHHSGKGPRPNESPPVDSDAGPAAEKTNASSLQVKNQTIRDLDGKIVFQGTIDLAPTLERIERGEANRHRNDGTSFQNREDRLPRKPAGYYKEYVHPTPHQNGPGPQRIIMGKEGEVWYTPDHYKTFTQIR
jgi:ribonuclease T1